MKSKGYSALLVLAVTVTVCVASDDDAAIKAKVEGALERHPAVAQSGIRVASVDNDGLVVLYGNAPSVEAHLLAVELAAEVPGVRSVATEVVDADGPSIPTSPPDTSSEVLTGCIREVGSRYVLKELAATGHALPEPVRPRTLILKSGDADPVRLDKHVANIVAVTGRVEATPTFIGTPTLVVSSLRHVSDTCQA
jgi:hypothetical protein